MRIITEKDKHGLLVAFRRFLKAMSGEKLSGQAGAALIQSAVDAGISFDALLNRENWGRAREIIPELTAADYVDALVNNRIDVRELTEEPNWNDPQNGFNVIAEAAHDFFMDVCERGGRWNIPSAIQNLSKAIHDHSLQAILSEELIVSLTGKDEKTTYFNFIETISRSIDVGVVDEPTEQQVQREKELEQIIKDASAKEAAPEGPAEEPSALEEKDPEDFDDPFPEFASEVEDNFLSNFIIPDPNQTKRDAIRSVLENFSPEELLPLVDTVNNGRRETINTILDKLTDGRFDTSQENNLAKDTHRTINTYLMPAFLACVNTQEGINMTEEDAIKFDILHESWDLRPAGMRKIYKLKMLVNDAKTEDPDILEAIADIERIYAEQEEED